MIKKEFVFVIGELSDDHFTELISSIEEQYHIKFNESLEKERKILCLWYINSKQFDKLEKNDLTTSKKNYTLSSESLATNPYKINSSQWVVYALIKTYQPISRRKLREIMNDIHIVHKKSWNIETSIDNTVHLLRNKGELENDKNDRYILKEIK